MGGQEPPVWFTIYVAAETWATPPWVLEEEAPAVWMDRFVAVANERAEERKRHEKHKGGGKGSGRRLI